MGKQQPIVRAVLDTNVLVAALRSRHGASYRLLGLVGDPRWRPCVSVALALEYEDVLKRAFMRPVMNEADVDDFLDYILQLSELVEVRFRLRPWLRDPDDDRILEVAVQARAVIVTFNTRDFDGAEFHGIRILRPDEFLQLIGESL